MNRHVFFMITVCGVTGAAPFLFHNNSQSFLFLALVLPTLWVQTYWRDIWVQLLIARGYLAIKKGNNQLLEKLYRKIYNLKPLSFAGKMSAGVIYTMHGNWERAETFFRQALYFKPGDLYVCLNLAVVLIKSEQYQEARKMLCLLIYSYPRCVQAYFMMAETCYHLGWMNEAKSYLLAALSLDYRNAEIREFLDLVEQNIQEVA